MKIYLLMWLADRLDHCAERCRQLALRLDRIIQKLSEVK